MDNVTLIQCLIATHAASFLRYLCRVVPLVLLYCQAVSLLTGLGVVPLLHVEVREQLVVVYLSQVSSRDLAQVVKILSGLLQSDLTS